VSDEPNFVPEPNAVWVSSDIDVEIHIKPGSVPKTLEDLEHFASAMNEYLIPRGAAWSKFVLFDETCSPVVSLEFELIEKKS